MYLEKKKKKKNQRPHSFSLLLYSIFFLFLAVLWEPVRIMNSLFISVLFVKGLPRSRSLIYRQRHSESVRGESIYKHKHFLSWGLCPPPPPTSLGSVCVCILILPTQNLAIFNNFFVTLHMMLVALSMCLRVGAGIMGGS